MNTIDFIRFGLGASRGSMMGLVNDLRDAPMAQPTVNGGNHALWILGHLVYTEDFVVHTIILGRDPSPLHAWSPLFRFGTEPKTDPAAYPDYDELLAKWEEVRAFTLATLDSMTDEDLDKPAPGCPEEWKGWFGTIAKALNSQIIHPTMHYGQLTDIRRSLGRPVLMA
ncbi:MAG: DinB family protein [Phycisphaerales bacterium]|nr:DinB family protein [Phycisphaerales bacterium]